MFFQFIFPLITQRGGTYLDKLEAQEKTENQFTDSYVILRNRFGNDSLLIIIAFLVGLSTALSAGTAEAIKQENFLVTNTTPELVVLRIYGDDLICVPFDRNTGEIEQNFTVLKKTGESGLSLKLENLGQLHLHKAVQAVPATPAPLPTETLTPATTISP